MNSIIILFFILITSVFIINQNNVEAQTSKFIEAYNEGSILLIDGKYGEAFNVFKKAYDDGDRDLCAFQLGECYFEGLGCKQDLEMAFSLHLISAQNNNPFAAYAVATDYYNGYGCNKNYNEAYKWIKTAAEYGFIPQAYNNYASMLANGEGCSKNPKEAFKWFLKGADAGDPYAQYTVAVCYYEGNYKGDNIGISKDLSKAKSYLLKSANQGHPKAAIRLDQWFK